MNNDVVVAGRGSAVAAPVAGLPAMVRRAGQALALAETPAETLEAGVMATFAYDAHRAAARAAVKMEPIKEALDALLTTIYRTQADALDIEAAAKRKFADQYDAGVRAGIFAAAGGVIGLTRSEANDTRDAEDRPFQPLKGKLTTLKDMGVPYVEMNKIRKLVRVEEEEPGFTRAALDHIIENGEEPTKAALGREINARLGAYSGDNEWYTPARYVDLARSVMGTIDVDPASNDHAQKTVKAATFYTAETDGLDKDWHGKVWMNPPYSNPEVQRFTEKVAEEYLSGRVTEAIILTNNAGDTAWHHALAEVSSAMCITRGRIRFESPTRAGNSPAMGQSFFYLGPNVAHFASLFGEVGRITTNYPVAVARALPGNDNVTPSAAA